MSAPRTKTWVKSAFSQLTNSQTAATETDLNCTSTPEKAKRLKRNASFTAAAHTSTTERETHKKKSATNWIDNFAPISGDELALHPKKVTELQNWLQHCDVMRKQYPAQLCLLTGPSGCGKTAATRVLAEACHYQLQEWINPLDQEVIYKLGDQENGGSYVGSRIEAFKSFLLRASRYKSLMDRYDKRLLLVEDFPNALLTDASGFENILEEYVNHGKSPLIFIVADAKTRALNISYNLFSDQLKDRFRITHISFNPVAPTLMQKAMKRFSALMRLPQHAEDYKVPAQSVIDSIVVSAQGDIRNALINLHFASLKGAPALLTQPWELEQSKSKQKKKQRSLKSIGRDESITMLHSLGRVFNPKFTDERRLLHMPQDIAEAYSTEPKKFINFMHANYVEHFSDIEDIVEASNGLSLADIILTEYREDALALIALDLGVRSLMVTNSAPTTGWRPIHGPKRWSVEQQERAAAIKRFGLYENMTDNMFVAEYCTYVKHIGKQAAASTNGDI